MTGHSPDQLMGSLVTVLNMVVSDNIGEGVTEKHSKAINKIRALGEDSVRVMAKNVEEKIAEGNMILF